MSEHTKGRLKAVVDDLMLEKGRYRMVHGVTACGSSKGMLDEREVKLANARRLAACWNAFENVRTELVELITMQVACDSMEKLPAVQSELAAARALLREVVESNWTLDPLDAREKHAKAQSYLDACDTPEGK